MLLQDVDKAGKTIKIYKSDENGMPIFKCPCGEETPSRDFTWSQDRNDTLRTRRERATIFKP
jgi:hypothetical protein